MWSIDLKAFTETINGKEYAVHIAMITKAPTSEHHSEELVRVLEEERIAFEFKSLDDGDWHLHMVSVDTGFVYDLASDDDRESQPFTAASIKRLDGWAILMRDRSKRLIEVFAAHFRSWNLKNSAAPGSSLRKVRVMIVLPIAASSHILIYKARKTPQKYQLMQITNLYGKKRFSYDICLELD